MPFNAPGVDGSGADGWMVWVLIGGTVVLLAIGCVCVKIAERREAKRRKRGFYDEH